MWICPGMRQTSGRNMDVEVLSYFARDAGSGGGHCGECGRVWRLWRLE